jgi:hypothetical protein
MNKISALLRRDMREMIHHVRIRARKRACPEPNRAGTLILDYQSPEL